MTFAKYICDIIQVNSSLLILKKKRNCQERKWCSPLSPGMSSSHLSSVMSSFQPYCLPTIPGKHTDLKSITADTMADLLNGKYSDVVEEAKIIDCRYPYEYEGGHISGALSIYRKDSILQEFMAPGQAEKFHSANSDKRKIIIFHCEFSSERGPKLARFLRNMDRNAHQENFPALDYPEIYLLHNGYKEFYAKQKVCVQWKMMGTVLNVLQTWAMDTTAQSFFYKWSSASHASYGVSIVRMCFIFWFFLVWESIWFLMWVWVMGISADCGLVIWEKHAQGMVCCLPATGH